MTPDMPTPHERARALIEAMHEQGERFDHVADSLDANTTVVGRLPTKTQFVAGVLVVIVALIFAFSALNWASQSRSRANRDFTVSQQAITRRTVVAAIQCLAGGVLPGDLDDCIEGIVNEHRDPPTPLPQNEPSTTSTTTTTSTPVHPAALSPPPSHTTTSRRDASPGTTVPGVAAATSTSIASPPSTTCIRLSKLPGCFTVPTGPLKGPA